MQKHIQNALILLVAIVVAWIAVPVIRHYLFDAFISGRTFSSTSEWRDTLSLLSWFFYISVFTVFGFILSKLINSTHRWLWVVSLGVIYTLYMALFSRNYFFQGVSFATYFWVYGLYAMPILGVSLGHLLRVVVSRRSPRHLTTQSS